MGSPDTLREGALLSGDDVRIFHMPPNTVPSGPDIGISPHAVNQCFNWLDAEAIECPIKLPQCKILHDVASHQTSLTTCLNILWHCFSFLYRNGNIGLTGFNTSTFMLYFRCFVADDWEKGRPVPNVHPV